MNGRSSAVENGTIGNGGRETDKANEGKNFNIKEETANGELGGHHDNGTHEDYTEDNEHPVDNDDMDVDDDDGNGEADESISSVALPSKKSSKRASLKANP